MEGKLEGPSIGSTRHETKTACSRARIDLFAFNSLAAWERKRIRFNGDISTVRFYIYCWVSDPFRFYIYRRASDRSGIFGTRLLDDQVVGCGEAVVVGGTAVAVAADVPVGTAAATAAAAAVPAAADVPVGTAAAVAKGQTNAAAVFGYFLVFHAGRTAAFHHFLRNRRNHYVGRRPLPRGLAETHRQRARGDRAGPPGRERLTASPPLLCGWHTHCE